MNKNFQMQEQQNIPKNIPIFQKTGIQDQFNATCNLIKSGLETTVLFMPLVYVKCGIVSGTIFLFISAVLSYSSWYLMLKVLNKLEDKSLNLTKAMGVVFGKRIEQLCDYFTIIYNISTLIAFTICCWQLQQPYLQHLLNIENTHYITIGILFTLYVSTITIKSVEKLSPYSIIGLIIAVIVFFMIIKNSVNTIYVQGYHSDFIHQEFSAKSIFQYFGLVLFYFDVNGIITEIRSSMEKPKRFNAVLLNYIVSMFFIAVIIGTLGSFAFGYTIQPLILQNMPLQFISFIYSFPICVTYILIAFPVFESLDLIIKEKINQYKKVYISELELQILIKLLIFIIITAISILYPNIVTAINIIGCFFTVILGFVFPVILYLGYQKSVNKLGKFNSIFALTVLSFGVIGGACGLYGTIFS